MKIIIFAGGSGKRFWPISRVKSPKQFITVIDKTSTYQKTVKRIQPVYGWHSIFISTNDRYVGTIKQQTPQIPTSHIFTEPARRDVGPAAGLALIRLRKLGIKEPVAILWSDQLMQNIQEFQRVLKNGEELILKKKVKFALIGEKPRYANANIGWISIGDKNKDGTCQFKGFVYRPKLEKCKKIFQAKTAIWNTACLISTVQHLLSLYEQYHPDLYKKLIKIEKSLGTLNEAAAIDKIYPTIEPIHFDHTVSYHLSSKDTSVINTHMGWDDPGTLYALKKYLDPTSKNVTKGNVFNFKSKDCLVYNFEKSKLVSTALLDGMIVVNTKDALLVVHKDNVRQISDMLRDLEKKDIYRQYL